MKKIIFIFFILFSVHTFQFVNAQDSLHVKKQKYRVSIDQKELFRDFDFDTLLIEINAPAVELKGYALKIAVQTQFFNIDNVIAGDFYNDCRWEFFNARQTVSDFSAENFLQVWQIIGLAEVIPDSISPKCFSSVDKTSLAKICISRNQFMQPADSIIPLFFLWEDCSDNTISGMSGNDLFVSDKVFQYYKNQPQFQINKFPTTQGIPANCTKASALNAPVKGIEFFHGGVLLKDRNIDDSLILNK